MLFWQALSSRLRAGALGCLLALLTACEGEGWPPPSFDATLRALAPPYQETTTFAQGTAITFELVVTNLSGAPQVLVFNTTEIASFGVSGPGGIGVLGPAVVPWHSGRDRGFAKGPVTLQFAPGEAKKFTETWDQRDRNRNGDQVIAGDYTASSSLVSAVGHIRAPLLIITILP